MLKSKTGKIISYVLRFGVAAGALYWAFRNVDMKQVGDQLLGLNKLIIIIAIITWLINQFVFVARWILLLRVQDIKISYWAAFRLHFLGIFYNNCLPGAVGGDFIRAGYATTHTDKKIEAVLSVFVDRFVGITSMILMALICYRFVPGNSQKQQADKGFIATIAGYWWIFAIVAGLILLAVVVFWSHPKGRSLLKKWVSLAWHKGGAILIKARKAMLIYWNHKIAFVFAYLLSFFCQGILIFGMWLIGRDLGIKCAAKYYFVFFPIAWMSGAIPVSVGGLGVWENVLKGFFKAVVEVVGEKELERQLVYVSTLALFHRMLWLFGSLPGVVIHLFGAHLPKDFSVDYEGAEG